MEDMDKRSMRRDQENQEKEHAPRVRVTELDLFCALPYGPAALMAATRGRTHVSTRPLCSSPPVRFCLHPAGRPHMFL